MLASEINLSQVIMLEAGLFFGPAMVGWATVAGILAGYLIRDARQNGFSLRTLMAKVGKVGQRRAKAGKGGQRRPTSLGSGIIKIIFTPKFWNAEPSFILGMQVLPLVAALEATGYSRQQGYSPVK